MLQATSREDSHALALTSELDALCAANADLHLALLARDRPNPTLPQIIIATPQGSGYYYWQG